MTRSNCPGSPAGSAYKCILASKVVVTCPRLGKNEVNRQQRVPVGGTLLSVWE